jgi:hypothetical protein
MLDVINAKPKFMVHIVVEWIFFISLYIRAKVPCLKILTLALHKILILVCTTQYLFVRIEWQFYNAPLGHEIDT